MNNTLKGAIWMCISALGMALMGATVKFIGSDISTFEKLFFRNLIGVFLLLYSIRGKNINIWGSSPHSRLFMVYRCIAGLTGAVLYFYCINKLYLADSSLLNKLSPFFVTIFATIFLKEKLEKHQIPVLIVVLFGALLVIKPKFSFEMLPALAGFMSAVFAGGAYTLVRYLRTMEEPTTLVLWFSAFSTIGMIPPMLIKGFVVPNSTQLLYLVLTGIFATIGQIALAYAYKYALASQVSIYQYLSIIFSAIIGFIFWKEIPDLLSLIGGCIILGAAFFNYKVSKKI
ncbi:DMT family transporter [Cetobacterium sp.]|uniref:DMT family transporter n=1 Tax=Cetobacterium sp. TaxID=2071632 RepID=UPI003FA557F9